MLRSIERMKSKDDKMSDEHALPKRGSWQSKIRCSNYKILNFSPTGEKNL